MKAELNYHRDAVSLLPKSPQFSEAAAEAIQQRERELGIAFPDSVREWYSLEGAVRLLRNYSNDDQPIGVSRLGEPFSDWYSGGRKDFVSEGLLLFMSENQGVCNWVIKLDGARDPPVLVEVDTAPDPVWLSCAERFSTFIWCQIWDHRPDDSLGVSAQEIELSRPDLDFLRASFQQLPTTHGWPGKNNYRFQNRNGRILIWDGEDRGVDWFVCAPTTSDLTTVLASIWHCGGLSRSLYDLDGNAAQVLDELRGGRQPTA